VRQLRRDFGLQLVSVLVAAAALLAGGCGGESASDKAASQVCDAKADIQKQIDGLRSADTSGILVGKVQTALRAIQADLASIAGAIPDLADDRRQQAAAATAAFKQGLSDAAGALVSGVSMDADDVGGQVSAALAKLGGSFKAAFSQVSC
jgi:hypothetical protein